MFSSSRCTTTSLLAEAISGSLWKEDHDLAMVSQCVYAAKRVGISQIGEERSAYAMRTVASKLSLLSGWAAGT